MEEREAGRKEEEKDKKKKRTHSSIVSNIYNGS